MDANRTQNFEATEREVTGQTGYVPLDTPETWTQTLQKLIWWQIGEAICPISPVNGTNRTYRRVSIGIGLGTGVLRPCVHAEWEE